MGKFLNQHFNYDKRYFYFHLFLLSLFSPAMSARITVLLPFYRSSSTLNEAVESIIDQSFQEWELVLIDNNADAESKNVALDFLRRDIRVKLISEQQQGVAFALNAGLNHSTGAIIARMDADDIAHSDRLKTQYDFLKNNAHIDVVGCQCSFSSDNDRAGGYDYYVQWQNSIISPEEHFLSRFIESPLAHPSVMFRKELIEKYGYYDTGILPEDYELWLRWMSRGVLFGKVPSELLIWRDRSERLSRSSKNYSEEAFFSVKLKYLIRWVQTSHVRDRKIVICGTGMKSRRGASALEENGIPVYAFTDIKAKNVKGKRFIPVEELAEHNDCFFISFIAKRGVREDIRHFFKEMRLMEGNDFILAG